MRELEITRLNKNFNGLCAVRDFNARFERGRITALVGPNGAGKTTVFNLINGFIRPSTGRITYGDVDLTHLPVEKIANLGIGRLFQQVRLTRKLSVLENMLIACKRQSGENPWFAFMHGDKVKNQEQMNGKRALEVLEIFGLQDRCYSLAENLSFGEQKLLALARLLMGESDVLLLDEPARGVNPGLLSEILLLLKKIADEGKAIIIIEHNMKVIAEIAEYVYFMNQGEIIAQGKTHEVLNSPQIREIYVGV